MAQSKENTAIDNQIKIAEFTPLEFQRISSFKKVIVKYKLKLLAGEINTELEALNSLLDGNNNTVPWKILSETPAIADRSGTVTQMFTLVQYV